jgi:hypothetical protein
MGAARSLVMAAAGAAGAAAVLAASPTAYQTLRRRLGLAHEREHFESDEAELGPADDSMAGAAAGDLRLSLRARLAQDFEVEQAEPTRTPAAAPRAADRQNSQTRAKLRGARERLEAKAAAAGAAIDAPGDPSVLEDDTDDLPLPGDS